HLRGDVGRAQAARLAIGARVVVGHGGGRSGGRGCHRRGGRRGDRRGRRGRGGGRHRPRGPGVGRRRRGRGRGCRATVAPRGRGRPGVHRGGELPQILHGGRLGETLQVPGALGDRQELL